MLVRSRGTKTTSSSRNGIIYNCCRVTSVLLPTVSNGMVFVLPVPCFKLNLGIDYQHNYPALFSSFIISLSGLLSSEKTWPVFLRVVVVTTALHLHTVPPVTPINLLFTLKTNASNQE